MSFCKATEGHAKQIASLKERVLQASTPEELSRLCEEGSDGSCAVLEKNPKNIESPGSSVKPPVGFIVRNTFIDILEEAEDETDSQHWGAQRRASSCPATPTGTDGSFSIAGRALLAAAADRLRRQASFAGESSHDATAFKGAPFVEEDAGSEQAEDLDIPEPQSNKMLQDCGGDLPSLGSANHGTGRCKPCAFVNTKGCKNGKACPFCHLCDTRGRKKVRGQPLRNVVHPVDGSRLGYSAPKLWARRPSWGQQRPR